MPYETVNSQWPEGTNDGRDITPTPEEAIRAAKRLYKKFMGRAWTGKVQLTSGRRYTWVRSGVFYVNPNETHRGNNGGWHELVHSISHYVARRLHREAHGPRHAWIEKEMIRHVVSQGWLDGKLKSRSRKERPDPKDQRRAQLEARLVRWESKLRRAENAIAKLRRSLNAMDRNARKISG